MNYIELIGPPGIGKTALQNTLTHSRKDKSWRTYEEAGYDIINSLSWNQLNSTKSKLLFLLNKINVINYKKPGIRNILIKELAPHIAEAIQKKYEYLLEAQLKAIHALPSHISPFLKYRFLKSHIQALQKLFILESFGYNSPVLFSKGPFDTHLGLQKIQPDNLLPDTFPNAVIYCTLSANKNMDRIKKGWNLTGRPSPLQNKVPDDHLEAMVNEAHNVAASNFAFIKMMGIPFFELNLGDPATKRELEKLHEFIAIHATAQQNFALEYV